MKKLNKTYWNAVINIIIWKENPLTWTEKEHKHKEWIVESSNLNH
jgi:hypothetical protein